MKLILHPGHAKCATTTIQNFLQHNRKQFHKNNILIPDDGLLTPENAGFKSKTNSPRPFFRNIMETGNIKILEERLEEIKIQTHYHTIVISAENLTNQLIGAGGKIHAALAKHFKDIKVLYYFKPQDKFILSAWQQWG